MRIPKYRLHCSGQARVSIRGKDYLLGPHNSKESLLKYEQLITEYQANGYIKSKTASLATLPGLLLAYLGHSESYYGAKSTEHGEVKQVIGMMVHLYPDLLANDFGPSQFRAVRLKMIEKDWNRVTINKRMQRVIRICRWAVPEGLMSHEKYSVLTLVESLKLGRCECREPEPVKPVEPDALQAVIKNVSPIVAAMIQLQRLTGSRPGEMCNLRPKDVDTSEAVWKATLREHKNAHRGKTRSLFFGPLAQAFLKPYMDRDPEAYCFSPTEAYQWHLEQKAAKRKTPKSCGNRPGTNKVRKPRRQPGQSYTTASYRRAIHRACDVAKIARWSPNRIRHLRGTEIRKEFGVEAAQLMLGHSTIDTTLIYAERDEAKLVQIAMQAG